MTKVIVEGTNNMGSSNVIYKTLYTHSRQNT